jgi:hypothetical protein
MFSDTEQRYMVNNNVVYINELYEVVSIYGQIFCCKHVRFHMTVIPFKVCPTYYHHIVSYLINLYSLGDNICHIYMFHSLGLLKDFVSRDTVQLIQFLAGKCIYIKKWF